MWRTCPGCGTLIADHETHAAAHDRWGDPLDATARDELLLGPPRDRDRRPPLVPEEA